MLSQQDNEFLTRIGPGTPMGNFLRRFWTPIFPSSTLPTPDCDPAEIRIFGEDLVAFRDSSGQVGLLQARCPHRQAPLSYGRNEKGGLRCIYHGWKFDTNGKCLEMPSEPAESEFRTKVRCLSYPVRERAGIIWAYLGPAANAPLDLPAVEWTLLPETHRVILRFEQACNFVQIMEGDLDSSHIGFLHNEAVEDVVPGVDEFRTTNRAPRWVIETTNYGLMAATQRAAPEGQSLWRINHWLLPCFTLIAGPMDGSVGFGAVYSPIDDTRTQVWLVMWSLTGEPLSDKLKYMMTKGPSPLVGTFDPGTGRLRANLQNRFFQDREAQRHGDSFSGIYGFQEQDNAVVEGMGEIVDRTKEHLGKSDAAIVAMRRMLVGRAKDLLAGKDPQAVNQAKSFNVRAWTAVLNQGREGFLDNPDVRRLMQGSSDDACSSSKST